MMPEVFWTGMELTDKNKRQKMRADLSNFNRELRSTLDSSYNPQALFP